MKTCLWLLALGSAASVVSAFASPSSTVQSLDIDLVAVGGGGSQQKRRNSNRLSTTLDMVASESQSSYQDQKNEFEINVGHAMDVLRSDYPDILHHKPGEWRTESFLPAFVSSLFLFSNSHVSWFVFRFLNIRFGFRID